MACLMSLSTLSGKAHSHIVADAHPGPSDGHRTMDMWDTLRTCSSVIKDLWDKHEGPRMIPRACVKKLGVAACAYNQSQ